MPKPQHHEVREFGLPGFRRPQGEFVEPVEAAGRGEPEPHGPSRLVGLHVVPHRSVPAVGADPEWPVEPQRRPLLDGPEPVPVRGQSVDQRAGTFLCHVDDPVMPVPHAHRASQF
ncbi:hypothetical protein DMC63_22645 [Streptomyces sp. WAC 05977]|nr:hypothetical protein DMC63_22645 [Streptomyces sp. WAC 05977]